VPSLREKTDHEGTLYWVHQTEAGEQGPALEPLPTQQHSRASADKVDRVYRELQQQLTLNQEHQAQLVDRGLPEVAIREHGFRSMHSPAVRATIARSIADRFSDWQGVPGFYCDPKTGKARLAGSEGLLIFGKDLAGNVASVKIRRDTIKAGQDRYYWLSSTKHGGPSSGSSPTWWEPVSRSRLNGVVRITEGAFKSVVSAELTGVPGIAAGSGVGSMASPQVLDFLAELNPEKVLVSSDADWFYKAEVVVKARACLARLADVAERSGLEVLVEVWQRDLPAKERFKGIDDALTGGQSIETLDLDRFLKLLPPEDRGKKVSQLSHGQGMASNKVSEGDGLLSQAVTGGHGSLCESLILSHSEGDNPVTTQAAELSPAASSHLPQTLEGALLAADRFREQMKPKDLQGLASSISAATRGVAVAPKFRRRVLNVLQRYEALLGGHGVNIHDVTASEQALRDSEESDTDKKDPNHQADVLLEMASAAQLIKHGNHHYMSMLRTNPDGSFGRETVRFGDRGNGAAAWLNYGYYKAKGRAPSSEAIKAAMATLEARCEFEGLQERVWLRVAESADGGDGSDRRLYHDLGDEHRRIVVISPQGWQVAQDVPVYFWRPKSLQALPEPVRGGSLLELREFLNLPDESSWILAIAFLIYSFVPTCPHPLLILEGEEGSCKTWASRILRSLVDPNGALTRRPPRNEEDLSLYALNSHLPCIDNVGQIEDWLSDGLCAITTGNGWGRRAKFTDEAESVVNVVRPVMMTGLSGLNGKSDLMDRTIKLVLQRVPPSKRQAESDLQKAFEEARPRILGAIYDVLAKGLANRGQVPLPALPRMADFARFIVEAEEALPWKPGQFMEAFREHRIDQVLGVLESDGLASAVRELMRQTTRWEGSVSQLHVRLSEFREFKSKLPGPMSLKAAILKLRPSLRHLGVEVSDLRTRNARLIVLEKMSERPSGLPQSEAKPSQETLAAEVAAVGELF
jgi:hypothetical protein